MSTNEGMQELIQVINQVQDAFTSIGGSGAIDLPQIAVVGGQSAGKSSVLENFVGKDFLPRGSGIVTRRPLVLQLQNAKEEYGEFLHAKGKRFHDFDDIRREIERVTDEMTGDRGVSSNPINLKVYSPHVLNLTVIDLPGLTKVAVGDQPIDIEIQIKNMLMEFISKDNCIILAVSPANADLANSDALKLAKEVDPQGLRTVGVITKLDLMDAGTDAKDILENKLLPLRRGYVGVVNRSQADINGNKDIRAALESERRFFLGHPAYKHLANKAGTKYLQQVLNQNLVNHIRDKLPDLKRQLQVQVDSLEKEVREIKKAGDPRDNTRNTKQLVKMINAYGSDVESAIEGNGGQVSLTELSGGARIAKVFLERFPFELAKVELDETELRTEIAFAIKNINGIRVGLFTPEEAFETIVKKLIAGLKPPCQACIEMVTEEVRKITLNCGMKLEPFPRLNEEIERIVQDQIRTAEDDAKDQVALTIDFELAYIDSSHPDFIGFANAAKGKKAPSPGAGAKIPNQVLRKGFLQIGSEKSGGMLSMKSRSKELWVVLTSSGIALFKDKDEKENRGAAKTEGLKVEDLADPKGCTFRLFSPDGLPIYKEESEIIFHTQNRDAKTTWQASLLRAGAYPLKERKDPNMEDSTMDPQLERKVDLIRELVDSYLGIVTKKLQDTVPKISMHMMVNRMVQFAKDDLLSGIYATHGGNADALLEESATAKQDRENILNIYESSKNALDVINKVSASTRSESLPPPLSSAQDWGVPSSSTPRTSAPPPSSRPGPPPRPGSGRTAPPKPAPKGRAPPPRAAGRPPPTTGGPVVPRRPPPS
eukprot:m.118917 g.118917  ORF g.118917 m.118917 type:complete len:824 (-) comp28710_c2_seq1:149-2620(-)